MSGFAATTSFPPDWGRLGKVSKELDRLYVSGYDQQGLTGDELMHAAYDARVAAADKIFEPGEDRSPTHPGCMCYHRQAGGKQLHAGAPFDTGPCYSGPDDECGFYPE